jgi:hypothetical protein
LGRDSDPESLSEECLAQSDVHGILLSQTTLAVPRVVVDGNAHRACCSGSSGARTTVFCMTPHIAQVCATSCRVRAQWQQNTCQDAGRMTRCHACIWKSPECQTCMGGRLPDADVRLLRLLTVTLADVRLTGQPSVKPTLVSRMIHGHGQTRRMHAMPCARVMTCI